MRGKRLEKAVFYPEIILMNSKRLVTFACTLLCTSILVSSNKDQVHYSDDILYGKAALDRVVTQAGSQVKISSQKKASEQNAEIKEIIELVGAVDELIKQDAQQKVSSHAQEQNDMRHAITFIKHVADLGLLAQRLFEDALPRAKKREYGFLWRDIGNATIMIWGDDLAKQFFRHPSFRRLKPDAQKDLLVMLNKRFTEHFRSFMVQNARSEAQAKEDFAYFYNVLPDLMITLLKRHYPSLDASMIYSK